MKNPNFFIIGAPKCGTTSLSEYLADHPRIFVSVPKEPLYFADDFMTYPGRIGDIETYTSIFRRAGSAHLAVAEASALYMYSSVAVQNIYDYDKNAKIVVMIRNPIDFLLSLHSQLLYGFQESEKDFEKAWRLQALRRDGKNVPSQCPEASLLQYAQIARFGDQLERVLNIFPKDQVKIILFEDFVSSTPEIYNDVLKFLNVPPDGRSSFQRINKRKEHTFDWLGKAMSARPLPMRILEGWTRNLLLMIGIRPKRVWHMLVRLTAKQTTKPSLSPEFYAELVSEFASDIEKLSKLIGRDLNHWMVPKISTDKSTEINAD